MKKLIDAQILKKTLLREEEELSNILFGRKEYPNGFIAGIQDAIYIANAVYYSTVDIESAITELQKCVEKMDITVIKCGYYFVLSFLHYINNELTLSILAGKCIIACYKYEVTNND